jgi:hypothetical protein
LEALKAERYGDRRGIMMRMIDFKAVENRLIKYGAKGPIFTPKPHQGPIAIY